MQQSATQDLFSGFAKELGLSSVSTLDAASEKSLSLGEAPAECKGVS